MNPAEPVLAAGVLIFHTRADGDRILLLKNRYRGDWGFPKGHSDPGEDAYATAQRELAEETGIVQFHLEPGYRFVSSYILPGGRNKGRRKEVTYFLATVDNDHLQLSHEHDEFCWATIEETQKRLPHGELRTIAREAFGYLTAKRLS